MNVNDAFPSKTLKAADLNGNSVTVTIDRVEVEKMGTDRKPVVYFQGKDKGLVLNKTNAKRIVQIAGTAETDHWKGHAITLFPTETEFQGDIVECIRVKAPARPAPAAGRPSPPAPPAHSPEDFQVSDEDVHFAWLLPIIVPVAAVLIGGLGA